MNVTTRVVVGAPHGDIRGGTGSFFFALVSLMAYLLSDRENIPHIRFLIKHYAIIALDMKGGAMEEFVSLVARRAVLLRAEALGKLDAASLEELTRLNTLVLEEVAQRWPEIASDLTILAELQTGEGGAISRALEEFCYRHRLARSESTLVLALVAGHLTGINEGKNEAVVWLSQARDPDYYWIDGSTIVLPWREVKKKGIQPDRTFFILFVLEEGELKRDYEVIPRRIPPQEEVDTVWREADELPDEIEPFITPERFAQIRAEVAEALKGWEEKDDY